MAQPQKAHAWSLSTLLCAVTSVVCMGSMGAMGIAASVGAAATSSMAGMEGIGTTPPPTHAAFTTQLLQSIGLGALTQIPDSVLRPIFVALLVVGIVGSYLTYHVHKHIGPLLLTMLASALLYIGIYVSASDLLYYVSLVLLLIGSGWNIRVRPAPKSTAVA
ncbi:MAG: MerC family mercury resistance protein [Aggregatilineales bacterium]